MPQLADAFEQCLAHPRLLAHGAMACRVCHRSFATFEELGDHFKTRHYEKLAQEELDDEDMFEPLDGGHGESPSGRSAAWEGRSDDFLYATDFLVKPQALMSRPTTLALARPTTTPIERVRFDGQKERQWTAEEDALVAQRLAEADGAKNKRRWVEIGQELGRSSSSVRNRMRRRMFGATGRGSLADLDASRSSLLASLQGSDATPRVREAPGLRSALEVVVYAPECMETASEGIDTPAAEQFDKVSIVMAGERRHTVRRNTVAPTADEPKLMVDVAPERAIACLLCGGEQDLAQMIEGLSPASHLPPPSELVARAVAVDAPRELLDVALVEAARSPHSPIEW